MLVRITSLDWVRLIVEGRGREGKKVKVQLAGGVVFASKIGMHVITTLTGGFPYSRLLIAFSTIC